MTLQVTDLMKLVYRDHIQLKHANRKRLASEVDDVTRKLDVPQPLFDGNNAEVQAVRDGQPAAVDVMSQTLVKYLMTAPRPVRGNI